MAVKQYLRLLGTYFKFNLASCMEYRFSFFSQVIGMVLNNAGFLVFWALLINKTGPLAGYDLKDVMFIWGLASAGFGLGHILFGNCRGISRFIINGDLDSFLLQPKNVYLNVLFSRMELSAWGDFIYGILLYLIFIGPALPGLLLFLGFVVTGALFYVSFISMLESLAFFTGSTEGLSRIGLELMLSFCIYPESIFPPSMRWVFYSLLPSGFIVFVPLSIIKNFNLWLLILVFGAALIYCGLAYLFFKWGLKRYESGNLMTTKL
ncbi:MAG: ABC-2 family transporter protein [Spirochaetales bacterium]|nr:ABC-2 family transporter protein [Spirochaetales bacterium]